MEFSEPLKNNFEFRRIYSRGKSLAAPNIVLYCRKNRLSVNRLGITVSAKLGHAVERNRIRRRLREIYRLHEHELLPGFDLIVVARGRGMHAPYGKLEGDFMLLSGKLGILR